MAASTGGALKALVEGLGLGLSAYRDMPPGNTDGSDLPRPYVTIIEGIHVLPDPMEDGTPTTAVETAQVDLWQDWRDINPASVTYGQLLESYTLAPALIKGLHLKRMASIGTPAQLVYIVRVTGSVRLLEMEENTVHHALTVEVNREL